MPMKVRVPVLDTRQARDIVTQVWDGISALRSDQYGSFTGNLFASTTFNDSLVQASRDITSTQLQRRRPERTLEIKRRAQRPFS